jgi:virginiamycin B lyase
VLSNLLRRLGPAVVVLVSLPGAAQTPTPTPTPDLSSSVVPASQAIYVIPSGGRYDAANVVVQPDGSVWSGSATENVIARLSPDGKTVTRWPMPANAAPSSFVADSDGTFWITELGGFNVTHFDPTTSELTQWPDAARRPTALVKRPDGAFWLPETDGLLAKFDPATGVFSYYRGPATSLAYPAMDLDGTLWACDFIYPAIVRYTPDGAAATRWSIPTTPPTTDTIASTLPSKIIRTPDGGLWISFWGSGQLGRFDEKTGELKVWDLAAGSYPYDILPYRGRILYGEQALGQIGVFDPAGATPNAVYALTPVDYTTTVSTVTATPVPTTLVPADTAIETGAVSAVTGLSAPPFAQMPAAGNFSLWGIAVDERRGKFHYGAGGALGTLQPPVSYFDSDLYVPTARSAPGPGGRAYTTGIVAWNRATPDSTGATTALTGAQRLLPSGWIAGFSPAAGLNVAANALVAEDDVIGGTMKAPGNAGALWLISTGGTPDLSVVARTSTPAPAGGTYGYSLNGVRADATIGPGETGFVFTPPDADSQPLVAGLLVLGAATGNISILDAGGQNLRTYPFDWPAGFQIQGETIWDTFSMAPVSGGRIAFSLTAGKVLPFGVSYDETSGDPTGLPAFGPKSADVSLTLPAVWRGGRALGASGGTDLQIFNAGASTAAVTLAFHAATQTDTAAAPRALPPVTVPPGQVVTLVDVLAPLGTGLYGTLVVTADSAVCAFARVHSQAAAGGTVGYGVAGQPAGDALSSTLRGVFVSAAEPADVATHDLLLVNPGDAAVTAAVSLWNADGTAAGTSTFVVAPHGTRMVPAVWQAIVGAPAALGRLDLAPDGPLFATLVRKDVASGDADALTPVTATR